MGACFGSEAYEDMYGPIRDDAAPDKPASDMFGSLLTMMTPTVFGSKFTDLACKVLTAPQRQFYSISELGPVRFDCDGLSMTREDVVLKNRRGVRIHGSYWSTAREWKTGATYLEPRPCVLYVHGAGSSRVEAAGQPLRCAIAVGASLLAIDTTAAGHSDGDRVSLGGAFEVADVACAVAWLKADAKVKDVVLWGRSAGAVACLGYAAEAEASDGPGPRVKGVLADSAFSDLGVICEDMFDKKASGVPRVMRSAVASAAYAEVKRVAGWDPRENRAAATVAAIRKTPCLFAAALDDDLVDKKHAAVLEKNCACPHKMRFERASRPSSFFFPSRDGAPRFDGGHNSTRPKIFLERAKTFIYLRLRLDRSPFGRDIRDHAKEVATPTEATVASRPKLAEISNRGRSSSAGATPAKKAAYGCLSPSYAHRGPPKASLSVSL